MMYNELALAPPSLSADWSAGPTLRGARQSRSMLADEVNVALLVCVTLCM